MQAALIILAHLRKTDMIAERERESDKHEIKNGKAKEAKGAPVGKVMRRLSKSRPAGRSGRSPGCVDFHFLHDGYGPFWRNRWPW